MSDRWRKLEAFQDMARYLEHVADTRLPSAKAAQDWFRDLRAHRFRPALDPEECYGLSKPLVQPRFDPEEYTEDEQQLADAGWAVYRLYQDDLEKQKTRS